MASEQGIAAASLISSSVGFAEDDTHEQHDIDSALDRTNPVMEEQQAVAPSPDYSETQSGASSQDESEQEEQQPVEATAEEARVPKRII